MVGDHPAIRQIDVLLELYSDHFWIHLDDGPHQPIADAIPIFIMIAVHLYMVSYLKGFVAVRRRSKVKLSQFDLLI
jgi:hypothetical protein